ncbi:DNA topoisomerase IB, partial [Rhizobiaceae sp. 2RAB30]
MRYVADGEAGILRRRAGRGFRYLYGATKVDDIETIGRIRKLAIPPAWTGVWISPDGAGHIQAMGRDQKGRRQYLYHPDWMRMRDEAKFSSLILFARSLPRLRRRIDQDLRKRGLPL